MSNKAKMLAYCQSDQANLNLDKPTGVAQPDILVARRRRLITSQRRIIL